MADNSVTIDPASVFDNPTDHRIEFRGEVAGEVREFGVRYSVLEALTGAVPTDPAAAFAAVRGEVATAALIALGRSDAEETIVVSERDLDQTGSTGPGPHAGPEADGLGIADAGSEAEAHPS